MQLNANRDMMEAQIQMGCLIFLNLIVLLVDKFQETNYSTKNSQVFDVVLAILKGYLVVQDSDY